MEIGVDVTDAIKRVKISEKDFTEAKGEKVKSVAFDEHIESCLDALAVLADGELSEYYLHSFSISNNEKVMTTEVTVAGLGTTDEEDRRLLVSVKDLTSKTILPPSLLLIEYTDTDDGLKINSWDINALALPESQNKQEIFVNALTQTVVGASQLYVERLSTTDKH